MIAVEVGRWLKGDPDAIGFILDIHRIAEVWDDLIDRDVTPHPAAINDAFHAALIQIPRNPFFQRNFSLLSPLLEIALIDWQTATAFETSGDREKLRTAFVLRCGLLSLTTMSARILGGPIWAQSVNAELRALGDTWNDYRKKHEVM